MATITSLGIGSNIDANSIVSQLVALEKKPLVQLQKTAKDIQTQMSSVGQIQSLFSKLQDSANALSNATTWNAVQSTTSDPAAVSVAASNGAPVGSYRVNVQSLAAAQTVLAPVALSSNAAPVGEGTMTIEIGSWDTGRTQFTARAGGNPVSITITASDTLATMRDRINSAGAGVTASIVTDSTGARLTMSSSESGENAGFRISVNDTGGTAPDAPRLSRFAFETATSVDAMQPMQWGANAVAFINDIRVSSGSNTLSGVLDGLTLTLNRETTAPVTVGVTRDTGTVKDAIKKFAESYSELAKTIGQMTRYDEATQTGGPLQGDSVTVGLLSRMRSLINTPSGASTVFTRLSDIGLTLQRDGTMSVNEARLDTALGRLSDLRTALGTVNVANPVNAGLARRFSDLATAMLGTNGTITNRTSSLQKALANNQANQDKVEARAETMQQRLVAQYSAMDSAVSRLSGLNSFVTAQLAALNRTSQG